ncbi:Leukocyte elastase inhibitor [Caligus rogercresseyi]|uniref:Leukocyte elastase inhibitor n=1 Tax=Caligus rogercresseyi TaxID=217165 RepID=A0A7T8GQD0_CALRO|nr:Leukocyte elastase inhibitor [Caligus rogercresseyi]
MDSSLRSKVISDLSHGVFNFNFKLFNQIKKDDKNGVFSGFSLATILSMTSLGAKGKTLKEIRVALGLPTSKKQVKQAYSSITRGLTSTSLGDGNVTLEIANGVFPQKNFKITSFFLKAQVKPLNYGSPAVAVQEINSWVDGRRFEARHTSNRDFHLASGSQFRSHDACPEYGNSICLYRFHRIRNNTFPYKGERFSMYILLPDEKLGLSGLEDKLDSGDLDPNVLDTINFESKRPVYLPKFKLSSSYDLKEGLQSIGIRRLFNHKADLSGIAGIRCGSLRHGYDDEIHAIAPTPVIIDRPFLFLIRDSESGMIVFSGRVLNPLEST